MIYLFIDTNILLSFYHFTSEDLDALSKLRVLVRKKKIQIVIPEQVKDEFFRNRDLKLADAMKTFRAVRLKFQYPQMTQTYQEFHYLKSLMIKYSEIHDKLIEKVDKDILDRNLMADKLFQFLFYENSVVPLTDEIFAKAERRLKLGNPPGKDNKIGDAINWETLLINIPDKNDLYIVTEDRDYASKLDQDRFNDFLNDEWEKSKKSKIYFFNRLATFFKQNFPEIELAAEEEKEHLIKSFIESRNFRDTHINLYKLTMYNDYSDSQLNDIVSGSITNSQVWMINEDSDIKNNLNEIVKGNESKIEEENYKRFCNLYGSPDKDV